MYGIDFGTSNTVFSHTDAGQSTVLQMGFANTTMPSVMIMKKNLSVSIGDAAIIDYGFAIDEFIGTGEIDEEIRFFQALKLAMKNELITGTSVFGKFWKLEDLLAEYLAQLGQ